MIKATRKQIEYLLALGMDKEEAKVQIQYFIVLKTKRHYEEQNRFFILDSYKTLMNNPERISVSVLREDFKPFNKNSNIEILIYRRHKIIDKYLHNKEYYDWLDRKRNSK